MSLPSPPPTPDLLWREVEVSPAFLWVFAIAPFMMPVLAIAAFVICLVIGIAVGGGSGGAAGSSGGGGGALIGLLIGGVLGAMAAAAIYIFLPLFTYLAIVLIYILITAFQEVFGIRMMVPVFDRRIELRYLALSCFLSVGLVSVLVYYLAFSVLGASELAFQRSTMGASLAYGHYIGTLTVILADIRAHVTAFGLIAVLATLVAALWMALIYVGGNYALSRSIAYCLGVYVTAFCMDAAFTVIGFLISGGHGYARVDFFTFVNDLDSWLRGIAIAPVRVVFELFADLGPLFDSLSALFSVLSDLLYALVEIGLAALMIEENWLLDRTRQFIAFSRFIEVDFLFFVIATALWAQRLQRHRKKARP